MNHAAKFFELTGLSEKQKLPVPSTVEEFLQLGRYYNEKFDELGAKGESYIEQVDNEVSRILAEMLQPASRQKYGKADATAIKQLITECWDESARKKWAEQKRIMLAWVSELGLEPRLEQILIDWSDESLECMNNAIANEAARLQLVPVENINELARVLSEMKEESDVKRRRNDQQD